MNLAYGEENGGQIILGGGGKFDALLMSRRDVEVRVLAIPPVADRDVEGFIGLRLRSVYPGNPKETEFDFRIVRQGAVRQAVVFIARRATVEKYREAAGRRPLVVPWLLLSRQAPKKGDLRTWICNGRWAESLTFHDGLLASSTVRRFARGRRFDLDKEERHGEPGQSGGRIVVAAPAADIEVMERIEGVQYLSLETLPAPRRGEGVFAPRARRSVLPPALRLAALGAAVIVLGLLVFFKEVRTVESHDARLRALITTLEKGNLQVLAIQKEIDDLGARSARLTAQQPRDISLLLSELAAVLGDGARLRSLSVRDDSFQGDAVGTNPLTLMEGFKTHPFFTGMKLAQVVPDPKTGKELFSFSGVFSAR